MPQYDAGSAALRIKPSFRGFVTEVETELKRYNFSMDVQVGADTSTARTEIEELQRIARENQTFRMDADTRTAASEVAELQRVAREDQSFRMGADTRVAASEIENLQRIARENQTFRMDANTATAAAEIEALKAAMRSGWNINPRVDGAASARARRAVSSLGADLRSAGSVNLKVLGVVGAAGAVAQLLAIADAASKAGRLVGLIPSVGFAGIAGAAGLATGLSGIPGAFKALKAASDDAAASESTHLSSLAAVQKAQFGVESSNRSLSDAYRDASRSIRDMNSDLEDQQRTAEGAALSVEDAEKRLNQVRFDPTADSTTRKRAQLEYDQAVANQRKQQATLHDMQQDTAEANAKGVEGSDLVVNARQAQTDAVEALRQATERLNTGSATESNLQKALAKLSPEARRLVDDVHALGPAWSEIRRAAQDALTVGIGGGITTLAQQQLPNLRAGLVGINSAFNTGFKGVLESLSSESNVANFKKTLDNTTAGFANAAKGAKPLTDAITRIITVGSEFFPKWGTGFADGANRFNDLIQRTADNGSLKAWLQEGIDSARSLMSILGNVGSSFLSVFRAAGDNGSVVKSLDEMTERLAKFLKSAEGQQELKDFFRDARENLAKLKPILADLPALLGGVYEGMKTWAGIALPFLKAAGGLLSAHPGLVRDILVAYLAVKTIGPIFDGVRSAIANAGVAMTNFRQGFGSAASGTAQSAGALGLALGPAGALGLAALTVGAGLGLTYLAKKQDEAAAAAAKHKSKLDELGTTLDATSGKVTEQTIAAAAEQLGKGGFLERARTLGVDGRQLTLASLGLDQDAKANINSRLMRIILEQKGSAKNNWSDVTRYAGLSDTDVARALEGVPEAVKKYQDAVSQANTKLAPSGVQLSSLDELRDKLNDIGESASTLGVEMNSTTSDVAKLGQQRIAIDQAANGVHELTQAGKDLFAGYGVTVDRVAASTVSLTSATDEQIARMREAGLTVERLPDKTVKVTLNADQAKADIQEIANKPIDVKVRFDVEKIAGRSFQGSVTGLTSAAPVILDHATGGRLPRTGPGTERRDGILGVAAASGAPVSWLDGGEWVINRHSSQVYDTQLAAINAGTFPRMAEGGVVGGSSAVQSLQDFARASAGHPYGGDWDCSGYLSKLANLAAGLPEDAGRMSTANEGEWLAGHGWQDGRGSAGAFRVGWINDPNMPGGGHTAGTLPNGVNVESNASQGVLYGSSAMGYAHPMFNQWAYLQMQATGATTPGIGGTGTGAAPGATSESVLSPQAALPGRRTDTQIQKLQGEAAVDTANSERNRVYADPNATDQDKLAADLKYQQAQNSLESSQNTTTDFSLPGFLSKAGSIVGLGILDSLGLGQSILSPSGKYANAINTGFNWLAKQQPQGPFLAYRYTPKNLPSVVTTTTPQTGTAPDTTTTSSLPPGYQPGATAYTPGAGSEQWRSLATQALIKEGLDPGQVNIMLAQIQSESGGDPGIVQQVTDVNSGGNEARGLLQVIPGTFATFRDPALPNDRTDPYANMVAALRYYKYRYGTDLSTMWGQGHGYARGGLVTGTGGATGDGVPARLSPGEFVVNSAATSVFRPWLERINGGAGTAPESFGSGLAQAVASAAWSPNRIDPGAFVAAQGPALAQAGHDFSVAINNPQVADVQNLVDLAERRAHLQAIGLMAAMR